MEDSRNLSAPLEETADGTHCTSNTCSEPGIVLPVVSNAIAPESSAVSGKDPPLSSNETNENQLVPVPAPRVRLPPEAFGALTPSEGGGKNYRLSTDGKQKLFDPLFEGSHFVLPAVDCSQFVDFKKAKRTVKNCPLAIQTVCSGIKSSAHVALSTHKHRSYVSAAGSVAASELAADTSVVSSSTGEQEEAFENQQESDAGADAELEELSRPGSEKPAKRLRRRKRVLVGSDPDWWFSTHCAAPGCPTCIVIGGFFRYASASEDGDAPPRPIGIEKGLHVWSSQGDFQSVALKKLKLTSECVHINSSNGFTPAFGVMSRAAAAELAEKVGSGASARQVHNASLAAIPDAEVSLGNTSNVGKNRKAVNQIVYRARRKEREEDGWKDDLARLEVLRQDEIKKDRAERPAEPDAKKRAKRVLGYVQSIGYYPRSFVLFTESQLILYRIACRLPEGLCADYTGQILRKVKVLLPCGDEIERHQFIFMLTAPNMFSGEPGYAFFCAFVLCSFACFLSACCQCPRILQFRRFGNVPAALFAETR